MFNELAKEVFANAASKGFHDDGPREDLILGKLMLIVTEIAEAAEEWRNGHLITDVYLKDGKPEGAPIELADALIRILDFCHSHHIDIDSAVRLKMEYNTTRPFMHGGKRA